MNEARFAKEHERVTLTPNRRLARALRQAHAAQALAAGQRVWETPRILPWEAFLLELWEQSRPRRCAKAEPPRLISSLAAATLWEEVIATSGELDALLPPARLVPEVMAAWAQLHAHGGDPNAVLSRPATPAVAAFAGWAEAYVRRCRQARWLDLAELPGALLADEQALAELLPRALHLAGFDRLAPQQEALLEAWARQGCLIHREAPPDARRVPRMAAFTDAAQELRAAAAWAAEQAKDPDQARIAVVFPDLGARRAEIARAFTAAMAPQALLRPRDDASAPFEISLGEALAAHPLVAPALGLLALAGHEAPLAEVFGVLRSPFLAEDAASLLARSALERSLLDQGVARLTPAALRKACRGRADLAATAEPLQRWLTRLDAAPARQTASAWRRQWEEELALFEWPAGGPLDSLNYQARQAWSGLLDDWIGIEPVLGRVPRDAALASLRRAAAERLFQPEGGGARVLILGVLEAAGLECDALWVSGLSARMWPRETRPSPYLPLAWQKAASVAAALPELAMAEAQTQLAAYLARAREIVFSRPRADGEEILVPSPLLAGFVAEVAAHETNDVAADTTADVAARTALAADVVTERIAAAGRREARPEDAGWPLPLAATASAYALNAQAACPFQAYGRYRLRAEAWPESSVGLSLAERGNLVHAAMAHLGSAVLDSDQLAALDAAEIGRRITLAVNHALATLLEARWQAMPNFVQEIERSRLGHLLALAVQMDLQRPPFSVFLSEERERFELAALPLSLRPDRIDRLADGRCLVIDYKTGRAPKPIAWLEAPPRDAQLPLYALAKAEAGVAGVVVLRLAEGVCEAHGITADAGVWPGLKPIAELGRNRGITDWKALLDFWRDSLAALASDYLAGQASVQPREPEACRYCPLPALCRIGEGGAAANGDDTEGAADD